MRAGKTLAVALAWGGLVAGCGPTAPDYPGAPLPQHTTTEFVLTADGLSHPAGHISGSGTVTFTNSDTVPRQIASDVHPVHGDCPELNTPVLQPGESVTIRARNATYTCGFHEETDPGNAAFHGTLTVNLGTGGAGGGGGAGGY